MLEAARPNTQRREFRPDNKPFSFPLLLRAFLALVRMDLRLTRRGFASLHEVVKQIPLKSRGASAPSEGCVCQAVDLACALYFKQVLCLQRSAAATDLLRRYGIPAEMVIGVQQCPFRAHAWVEVAGKVINDKPYTSELYTVMDRC